MTTDHAEAEARAAAGEGAGFSWAIGKLIGGHRIARKAWPAGASVALAGQGSDSIVYTRTAAGEVGPWAPTQADVLGCDWLSD